MRVLKHLSKRQLTKLSKSFREKAKWHQSRNAIDETAGPVANFRKPDLVVRRLAPNLDQLVIVSSLGTPRFKPRLVDRLLILASLEQLPVVVVINKVDLAEQRAEAETAARTYRAIGIDALVTSAVTEEGVEVLRGRMEGRSSGLVGHSGVGKSSLLRVVNPTLEGIRVGEVSDWLERGKHTTTEVRFFALDGPRGGRVYDLPGLKAVPLQGVHRDELYRHFLEFEGVGRFCRFGDCRHLEEPDCAVRRGLLEGTVPVSRYESYRELYEELGEVR